VSEPKPAIPGKKVQGFTWTVEDVNLISENEIWGDVLVELAAKDERIVALTADLAHSTKLRRFKETFPGRFFNVGIAEQNLMAVAAGLAATGLVPVVGTYATFATLRAAEFVRTDIGYNQRNVKIIGTLAGVAFGQGGPTHHSVEDLALTRAIPGMVVLAPSDGFEMGAALRAALAHDGPVYLRTGRGVELPLAERKEPPFAIGTARVLREGSDVAVLACGPCVQEAMRAAERAAPLGVSVRVLNMTSVKPLDEAAVRRALTDCRRIVTVEDHSVIGGLGSAVADVIARSAKGCAFRMLGHPDRYLGMGVPEDLMHLGGFDEDAVLQAVCELKQVTVTPDDDWDRA
jgi:transketolase